jgi:hypothetical protein
MKTIEFNNQADEIAQALSTDPVPLDGAIGFSCVVEATVSTPTAKTFLGGVSEVTTLTFETKADSDAGDYFVIYDTAGLAWAASVNKAGTDPEPTGAVWAAIPAARKVHVDISSATTAAQVAALFELGLDALTSVPFATDDSAADGTMLISMTLRGNTTNAVVKNADDSGAGGIGAVVSTPGVDSAVNITANTITKAAHGLASGLKGQLTSTGTIPGGFSLATDYYVLVVDANTFSLSASLNGAAVDITNQGTAGATHTFTATAIAGASVKLQATVDPVSDANELAAAKWFDIANTSNNITVTADFFVLEKVEPMYRAVRATYAMTAGQLSLKTKILVKGA